MLFYLLLIAASPFVITAFPQNLDNTFVEIAQVEPVASKSIKKQENAALSKGNDYEECIANCFVTTEYNPVCGTDNVTYSNPGSLNCAKKCGKDVELNYYGCCSTSRTG
ncbi:PREDICTED: uncharacterized protein LOC108760405 [Trachymyrmex cornetzi]|uniref:uncharacterized protein LOC108760405 n=1 Tax=Trachymyrmex cornetzi TaxID=471704 RepID=UPI00084F10C6|nr:PREDICTED: uncharacterized protein LOC108760405 [Trachymyrmex cornetzi]